MLDIVSEYLKYATENSNVIDLLVDMFRKVWIGEEIPGEWGLARIEALYKMKGKITNCTKYTGLSIGSTVAKLFCAIIINCLKHWYNAQLAISQYGFRQGAGAIDVILKDKQIQRIVTKMGKSVYTLCIDHSAEFDRCIRPWIFQSLRLRAPEGSDTTLIDLLERFYLNTSTFLRQDKMNWGFGVQAYFTG